MVFILLILKSTAVLPWSHLHEWVKILWRNVSVGRQSDCRLLEEDMDRGIKVTLAPAKSRPDLSILGIHHWVDPHPSPATLLLHNRATQHL